ncbi:MAG: hypothetical protein KF767_14340 [Bdellovibrionaceae bacterium]|nr:hypothetical protein [Pseudobdellovibrionaceae bacterium]
MRILTTLALSLISLSAFAGHPASDAVANLFEEAERIQNGSAASRPAKVCNLIKSSLEHRQIAQRLLGRYASSADKNGVNDFLKNSPSIMVTKAMPQIQKLVGKSGSWQVDPQASARGNGYFAVSVRVTSEGKSYNAKALVSPNMKISDVEYWGFSGVNYASDKLVQDIDKHRNTGAPVTAYMKELRSQKDWITCP